MFQNIEKSFNKQESKKKDVKLYKFEDIKELGKLSFVSASLIFGGAIGNLIDRIRFGYVVDFLDLRWWPVFNVADIALTVGVALLFIEVIRFGQNIPAEVEAEVAQSDKVEEQVSAEEVEEERDTCVKDSATSEEIAEAIESKLPPSQI